MALSERLISRVLSHLTLAATAPTSRTAPATAPACQGCRLGSLETWRNASSSSQWKSRQSKDRFARQAKVQGLKSRAAWKLIEVRLAARRCPPLSHRPRRPWVHALTGERVGE